VDNININTEDVKNKWRSELKNNKRNLETYITQKEEKLQGTNASHYHKAL
jgi:hypothetical protein